MIDLTTPDLPPALDLSFSQLQDAFRRLSNLVKDMSQEEFDYPGPAGSVNSTATLIAHITFCDLGYLHCIKGAQMPAELEALYGPDAAEDGTLPKVTGMTVAELLNRHQQVLTMIKSYLQSQTDADASRPVTVSWWPQPATVRAILWHMASHSMLHQGQISRLRAWYKQTSDIA